MGEASPLTVLEISEFQNANHIKGKATRGFRSGVRCGLAGSFPSDRFGGSVVVFRSAMSSQAFEVPASRIVTIVSCAS
jgi:hypothetical protein